MLLAIFAPLDITGAGTTDVVAGSWTGIAVKVSLWTTPRSLIMADVVV